MPAIVVVSGRHAAFLADEFRRYGRDYGVHTARGIADADQIVTGIETTAVTSRCSSSTPICPTATS